MKHLITVLFIVTIQIWSPALPAADDFVAMSADRANRVGIETTRPETARHYSSDKLPGEVVVPNAQKRVISAPQSGLLEVMLVAVGEHVDDGQTVARIQSPDLIALQSDLLQTQSRLNLANSNFQRDKQLYEEGIIAERRYLEARSRYQELAALMEQRRQTLHLAGMDDATIDELEHDKRLSGSLEIRAPIDGVIMEQMAVAGQRIEAATPLYRVSQLAPLWLEIHVPLERTRDFRVGDPVRVTGTDVEGHIITIGSEMHSADQGILLRAEVNKDLAALRPGQFVQVIVECECRDGDSYSLPRSAIVRMGSRTLVLVRSGEGFAARDVRVVKETDDNTIVSGDLALDDAVVISGTATLKAALSGIGGGE